MNFNDREKIIQLTPQWTGERLPDGRPKVDEKYRIVEGDYKFAFRLMPFKGEEI